MVKWILALMVVLTLSACSNNKAMFPNFNQLTANHDSSTRIEDIEKMLRLDSKIGQTQSLDDAVSGTIYVLCQSEQLDTFTNHKLLLNDDEMSFTSVVEDFNVPLSSGTFHTIQKLDATNVNQLEIKS